MDVDYPELIAKKCEVISQTPQLTNLVGPSQVADFSKTVLYRGAHYIAIGCDLADTQGLEELLAKELDAKSCMVLCTAEVSVTYMDTKAADSLIAWAAQYEDSMSGITWHCLTVGSLLTQTSPFLLT